MPEESFGPVSSGSALPAGTFSRLSGWGCGAIYPEASGDPQLGLVEVSRPKG